MQYDSLDQAISSWEKQFGDRVQGVDTPADFVNGLEHPKQGQPYNANVDGYTKGYMNVYRSMGKWMNACGVND